MALLQFTATLCNIARVRYGPVQRYWSSQRWHCVALVELATMALVQQLVAALLQLAMLRLVTLHRCNVLLQLVMLQCCGAMALQRTTTCYTHCGTAVRVAGTWQRWQAVLSCSASMATAAAEIFFYYFF